jgi:thymidylate synthase
MDVPQIIGKDHNLSTAWLEVFEQIVISKGKSEMSPLVLTLTDFSEEDSIKSTLNEHLQENKFYSIETVAQTIFPDSLHLLHKGDRNKFFQIYLNYVLPRLKKIDLANKKGTYFERLIAYGSEESQKINQLEIIISSLQEGAKVKRRSKLQASTFDATIDHLPDAYQKFPCLSHVTFLKSENGGLIANSFYPVQSLYKKAYGNWLGLINLGKFVAKECNLELERFNCFVGVEQLQFDKRFQRKDAQKLLFEIKYQRTTKQ